MNIDKMNTKRSRLFQKWNDLEKVIHVLEATANVHYSVFDKRLKKGRNVLLSTTNKLKPFIDGELIKLQEEVRHLDVEMKRVREKEVYK